MGDLDTYQDRYKLETVECELKANREQHAMDRFQPALRRGQHNETAAQQ